MPDYARDQHGNLAEQVARRGGGARSRVAAAKSGLDLAKAAACTACHGVSERIVGPGFREVAARYAGDAGAPNPDSSPRSRRAAAGAWGAIPMPAQPQVKDADARALVQWILGGAK